MKARGGEAGKGKKKIGGGRFERGTEAFGREVRKKGGIAKGKTGSGPAEKE